jgi:two-component system chemotaxis sensor kinase CheA
VAKDPYRYFRVEARELLDQLAKAILDLEKGAAGPERVALPLRLAHTLKGAARVVKQREISDLAHSVEDALAPYREGRQAVARECIDRVLATLDAITAGLARLPGPEGGTAPDASAAPAETLRTVRAEVADVNSLLEGLGEVHGELAALRRAVGSAERARHNTALLAEQLASPRLADDQRTPRQVVSLAKARSMAEQLHNDIALFERSAAGIAERMDRELRQARELTERLRLVPAGSVFNALERVARDAAHSVGKRVAFDASGGDVRLDGHVLDAVQGALVQIVRNAVVHGIETEAERTHAGKPSEGHVVLEVSRHGHRVSFRCLDDGAGVDLEGVRSALQRKGTLPRGAERLGPAQLLQLLLKGGITTSGTVTELSGRGIGLDVVREVAERLGGDVSVQTAKAKGTTLELRVPVSLASLDALIVEADGEVAAIPLDAVRGTLRVMPGEVARAPEGDAIAHEGNLIPLVALGPCLARNRNSPAEAKSSRAVSAVVVAGAAARVAVAVDRLRGTETIMLRALPALAPADAIVAGIHIDSDGNPRPVLDPEALVNPAQRVGPSRPTNAAALPILVIDDSVTTRMLEQSILESAGYQVDLATSGEEALEMARRNHYGLFLVDIEMPGMDGFAFIEASRADPQLRNVPSILVTSRESSEDRRRGEAAGAHGYIVKGEFDQREFLERIATLIRR